MKYVISLMVFFLLFSFETPDSVYEITLKTIDGKKIELSQYKGKKLLFLLLPLSSQDTTISVNDLAGLQTKYQRSLVVIGIPSEEAGYRIWNADMLKKLYKDAGDNLIITEGMKVKKGRGQSPLFQWLTNKNMNCHFDHDVQGIGSKFFVDEDGELYAVMGPKMLTANPLMERILTRKKQK